MSTINAAKPVKRSILEEMLEGDFEHCVDAAYERMAERKPSHSRLRKLRFIQKDWNDYIGGFKAIKRKAHNCKLDEYAHYKWMIRMHEGLAITKFGIQLQNKMRYL